MELFYYDGIAAADKNHVPKLRSGKLFEFVNFIRFLMFGCRDVEALGKNME